MQKTILLLSAAAGFAVSANAQAILVAGWDFSNVPGSFTGNTVNANYSDLFAGDGEAFDGAAGTLYADGSFTSTALDNSGAFTIVSGATNSAFNRDVNTPTRPDSVDFIGVDGANNTLTFADGSFGLGGAADASGATLVFAAFAPAGLTFDAGTYSFSYAAGAEFTGANVLNLGTSTDGVSFTLATTDTLTSADELGQTVSIATAGGETRLFYSIQLPSPLDFGYVALDNVQITGPELIAIPEPAAISLFGVFALVTVMVRRRRA